VACMIWPKVESFRHRNHNEMSAVLVTVATLAIFAYWWLMPTLIYGLLCWRKNQAGFTYTELLCIYGYSLSIYIPISVRGIRCAQFQCIQSCTTQRCI